MSNKIAEVIPYLRTIPSINFFDYSCPASLNLRIGDIVKINFRNQEKIAFIYKFKNNSIYKNIKPILSKIDKISLSENQINIITWLSAKYQISLPLAFQTIFPEIPKKNHSFKSKDGIDSDVNFLKPRILKNRVSIIKNYIDQIIKAKENILLTYSNNNEKNACLMGLLDNLNFKKQTLILVPEKKDLFYLNILLNKFKPTIIHSGLNKNKLWQAWQKIKFNETNLIIGTKTAIFMPPDNLETIIIDNEEDKSHGNYDQNPKYHVLDIAFKLNKKIILTSVAPSIGSYYHFSKKIKLFDKKNIIEIIDLNSEKARGNYSYFSEKLLNSLAKNKKSLLLFNRKGEAKYLICKQCHEILPYQTTQYCPFCRNLDLKKVSFGIKKLLSDLKKIFPDKIIYELSDDNRKINSNQYDIIIGTEYALKEINMDIINFIGIISVDHQLAIPHYQSSEKVMQLILKIAALHKPTMLQTHSPDNFIIQCACQQNYEDFYQHEIKMRKKYHYPPFDKKTC